MAEEFKDVVNQLKLVNKKLEQLGKDNSQDDTPAQIVKDALPEVVADTLNTRKNIKNQNKQWKEEKKRDEKEEKALNDLKEKTEKEIKTQEQANKISEDDAKVQEEILRTQKEQSKTQKQANKIEKIKEKRSDPKRTTAEVIVGAPVPKGDFAERKEGIDERKNQLDELRASIEETGGVAEDNKKFNKLMYQQQKEELQLRLDQADSPSARKEIRNEQKALAAKQGNLLKKIATGIGGLVKSSLLKVKNVGGGLLKFLKKTLFAGAILGLLAFVNSSYWDDFVKFSAEGIAKLSKVVIPKLKVFWEDFLLPFIQKIITFIGDSTWENLSEIFGKDFTMKLQNFKTRFMNFISELKFFFDDRTWGNFARLFLGADDPTQMAKDNLPLITGIVVGLTALLSRKLWTPLSKLLKKVPKVPLPIPSTAGATAGGRMMSGGQTTKTGTKIVGTDAKGNRVVRGPSGGLFRAGADGKPTVTKPVGRVTSVIGGRGGGDPTKQGNTARARNQFSMDRLVKRYPRFNMLRAITKRIPIIGYALGGMELTSLLLSDAKKEDKIKGGAKILGGLGGSAMGAIIGGTLGTYIPLVGTAIGALGGGVIGYSMGEKGMGHAMEYLLGGGTSNKDAITKNLQGELERRLGAGGVLTFGSSGNAIRRSAKNSQNTTKNGGGVPTSTNIKVNKPLSKKQRALQQKEMKFMNLGPKPYAEFLASRFKGGSEFNASNLPNIQSVTNENASKMIPIQVVSSKQTGATVTAFNPTNISADKTNNHYSINQKSLNSNVPTMLTNAL